MSEPYFDLGPHTCIISTDSADAQTWFNRGLMWCYGFNHEEAVRCFRRAAAADENCAMAWWGIAHASGSNYNKMYAAFAPDELREAMATSHAATHEAIARLAHASPQEQALIRAMPARYPTPAVADEDDFMRRIDAYASALRPVYAAHGRDHDVAALFAEAMMNRTPWKLWDPVTGKPSEGADTEEVMKVLEQAMRDADATSTRQNPGVMHLYVHTMEMSPFPERAMRAADGLREFAPDAGHLLHMPSHIDVQTGGYHAGVVSNHKAIIADRKYLAREGRENFYTMYRLHDMHFKTYCAMFLGQYQNALAPALDVAADVPESFLRLNGGMMADLAEAFVPMKFHVYVRFGKWQEILAAPFPADKTLYAFTTALQHYARGVAHAATGAVAEAEAEQQAFLAATALVPETRTLFNSPCVDVLAIAKAMLAGEIEYRKGNHAAAFAHLRESVRMDESLPYDEPWGWMQPPRHALGALLLEQGHVAEAAAVYRADLGLDPATPRTARHPDNVWSLHGYVECLRALGHHDQMAVFQPRLDLALARADAGIGTSCYCRTGERPCCQ